VAGQLYYTPLRPPPLYRLARGLRRASLVVLILLILYVATAAYSAASLTRSSSHLGQTTTSFGSNNTVVVGGVLTLNNPGFYPVNGFTIAVRIGNASNVSLGQVSIGPFDLAGGGTSTYQVSVYVPINASGPARTLLTHTQNLEVHLWANATYAYLFPVAIAINETRSWGAPFANLNVTVGTVTVMGGVATVPVTVSFQNEASFADQGTLDFAIVSSGGATCGTGSFAIDVPPNQQYDETQPVTLATGCNPAGGEVTVQYVTPSYTVTLPPEPIP
jgi:hypothetical protein